ncbi:2OG-Fe(II) oxygenase [Burkholderiaceae bacterium DAT-1]|nr:2OG-Fe(II) oxygenase [Burkholderiaceae bacterium DAT-1]
MINVDIEIISVSDLGNHPAGIFGVEVLSPAECDEIIRRFSQKDCWEDARVATSDYPVSGEIRDDYRKAMNAGIDCDSKLGRKINQRLRQTMFPVLSEAWHTPIEAVHEISVVYYNRGGHFECHTDNDDDFQYRRHTIVIYLNDVKQGGETAFPDLDLQVQPRKGWAVAFPSGYLHRALPVTRGEKYVLTCWSWGEPPIQWI